MKKNVRYEGLQKRSTLKSGHNFLCPPKFQVATLVVGTLTLISDQNNKQLEQRV